MKWDWLVETDEEIEQRQKDIDELMKEKEEQIKKLQFEVACLFFLRNGLKV